MRKILKNNVKTKKRLEKLPKICAVVERAKWDVLELPWSKRYDANCMPLVYHYYDANGYCDEWHLVPINRVSSGRFWDFFKDKVQAEHIRDCLNSKYEISEEGTNEDL